MIDLTKITPDQANKIEMVLVMMEDNIKAHVVSNEMLAEDKTLSEKVRNTCRNNAQWWKEVHTLIYGN